MLSKKITIILTVLIIMIGAGLASYLSSQKQPIKKTGSATAEQVIQTLTVENYDIPITFEIGGTIRALNKIDVYAEVSGVLQPLQKPFKEGQRFSQGEVIIKIDDAVYLNNLLAQKSSLLNQLTLLLPDLQIDFPVNAEKWENYLNEFELEMPLKPLPETGSDRERNYIAARNIYSQYYTLKSMEATLAKYTLTAPYDGVVTQSEINSGTLVRSGQMLGEFTNTAVYEMEASAGINEVQYLQPGQPVVLHSEDISGDFTGVVKRINEKIDQTTQTVTAYIAVKDARLKDGMYLTASISAAHIKDALKISSSLLVENDKLYVLQDSLLVLQSVEIVGEKDGEVIINGLPDGTQILAQKTERVFDGMKIARSESAVKDVKKNSQI